MVDPRITGAFAGSTAVAHLAVDLAPDADRAGQRRRNTRAAQTVLTAAFAAGVRRVVVVSSALAYGAYADNPVPLGDDAPLRAVPEASVVGDLLEIERIAAASRRSHRGLAVTVLRPAVRARRRRPGADGGAAVRAAAAADPRRGHLLAVLPRRRPGRRGRAGRAGRRPASSTARPTSPAPAGSTTTSWSGSAAGAAWSCRSGSRSARRSGCTGWASRRPRRASWPTSCTRGWSTARGCGRPAGSRGTATPRRSPTTCGDLGRGGAAGRPRRHRGGRGGRRGGRARRHRGAGPAGPPPPVRLTVHTVRPQRTQLAAGGPVRDGRDTPEPGAERPARRRTVEVCPRWPGSRSRWWR